MHDFTSTQFHHIVHRKTFAGWEIRPRVIPDHELVLILRGQGAIMIDQQTYTVRAGDLICFYPGMIHSLWLTKEPYMEFYGMHFALPENSDLLNFPALTHLESTVWLESLLNALHDIHKQQGYHYEARRDLWVQQILYEISALLHEKKQPIESLRIRKALNHIHKDPCRPIPLEEFLKLAGIQKTMFLQSFRKFTGTTPTQYIIRQRLEYAKELLLETKLPITQIAEQCGFTDAFYFSRCFQKHLGLSPRQYRQGAHKAPDLP